VAAGDLLRLNPKIQLNCCPPLGSEVNTCEPLNGVEENGLGGMVTGTGCVDSLGNSFLYHYVYHNQYRPRWDPKLLGYFETGVCRFKLGDFSGIGGRLTGDCRGTVLTNPSPPGGSATFHATGELWACNPPDSNVPPGGPPSGCFSASVGRPFFVEPWVAVSSLIQRNSIANPHAMGGPHHVAREATFEAKESGMRSTVVGGCRIVVVTGQRRLCGNRHDGNGYADAESRRESRNHLR
jgi:hypothetical protein